jgi:hypothetical protein
MTDRLNELYWEVVWPEVDDAIAVDNLDAHPFRTPHALVEWREGERFGATHLQGWSEKDAGKRNRASSWPRPSELIPPWHGQNFFCWARNPVNWREERG